MEPTIGEHTENVNGQEGEAATVGQNDNENAINELLPNQTLYIKNLNEKIKPEELKQALFQLFSQFGEILEIHAKKNIKMRGQAFIVFRDVEAANRGMHSLQGQNFFGKDMLIMYSKTKSDVITKIDGSYDSKVRTKRESRRKQDEEKYRKAKKSQLEQKIQARKEILGHSGMMPNSILFVENLPTDTTNDMLGELFKQYAGFKEVRMIPGKNVSFVEYESEYQAGVALVGMNNFQIDPENKLAVSFAKR